MHDRSQLAIRIAALERVRDDLEVMLDEANLALLGLASSTQPNEVIRLKFKLSWLDYRNALVANLHACGEWGRLLKSVAQRPSNP